MKFGKSLARVVELSNPEWGPFWINYKYLKRKINDIVNEQGGKKHLVEEMRSCDPHEISKSTVEVEFFRLIRKELKKVSDFFLAAEQLCRIRKDRITEGFAILKELESVCDSIDNRDAWRRLLASCVRFYKDVLLLENFAIMNYCGFSKILKKHDKLTGFATKEAFLNKVMSKQNFTQYPYIVFMLKESERVFEEIKSLHSTINSQPLLEEERLFIEAIRDLNRQSNQSLQTDEDVNVSVFQSQQLAESTLLLNTIEDDSNSKNHMKIKGVEILNPDSVSADHTNKTNLFPNASAVREMYQHVGSHRTQAQNGVKLDVVEEVARVANTINIYTAPRIDAIIASWMTGGNSSCPVPVNTFESTSNSIASITQNSQFDVSANLGSDPAIADQNRPNKRKLLANNLGRKISKKSAR